MAQFLKSQSPDELWTASLKPKDPFKPADLVKPARPLQAATAPGIGLTLDVTA